MEDIFRHMKKVKQEMEKSFNEFFEKPKMLALPTMGKQLAGFKQPLGEISVKGDRVVARLEMPGVNKKDVVLNIGRNFIEVKAEKKEELKEENKGFLMQEKSYHGFYRKMPLPMPVKPELAESHFTNGVFEISMPLVKKPKH